MKKINFTSVILMIACISCQKEQSPTTAANQVSQSNSSAVSSTCKTLPEELAKHLAAYYPFCGNANDESGNGNNPDFNSATLTSDRFGNANSAYNFNGDAQYIKGICSKYPKECRTISLWFKLDDFSDRNGIFGYGGGSCGTSFLIEFNPSEYPNQYFLQGHCRVNSCITRNGYPPNVGWNNLIITTGKNVTKLYMNGAILKTFKNVDFSGTSVSGKDFIIGAIVDPSGKGPFSESDIRYLKGSLDDIIIYNWVLGAAKVKALYDFFSTQ